MVDCYVGLGGNLSGTLVAMRQVIDQLERAAGIEDLIVSRVYETTPVSAIPQSLYLNAVCRFQTRLPLATLWELLQSLEKAMGKKVATLKNSPRLIDLDLLFYGPLVESSKELTLPHPRWQERLFVLTPLADVTEWLPNGVEIGPYLKQFANPHQERVSLFQEKVSYAHNSY